jgi:hypothetical protein
MFIYNAAAKKYSWSIRFPNPATAGDIRSVDNARWVGAVSFDDSVITVYEWREADTAPVVRNKVSLDAEVRAIAIAENGRIFAACNDGVYEVTDDKVVKHIDGSFSDIKCRGNELVTADVSGCVTLWKE